MKGFLDGYDKINNIIPRHFAFIFNKKELLSVSHNLKTKTYFCRNFVITTHAEMQALLDTNLLKHEYLFIEKLFKTFDKDVKHDGYTIEYPLVSKPISNRFKHLKLFILRLDLNNGNNTNDIKFIFSKPCLHCANTLALIGLKNIYYTTDDGNFVKLDLYNDKYRISCGSFNIKFFNNNIKSYKNLKN